MFIDEGGTSGDAPSRPVASGAAGAAAAGAAAAEGAALALFGAAAFAAAAGAGFAAGVGLVKVAAPADSFPHENLSIRLAQLKSTPQFLQSLTGCVRPGSGETVSCPMRTVCGRSGKP